MRYNANDMDLLPSLRPSLKLTDEEVDEKARLLLNDIRNNGFKPQRMIQKLKLKNINKFYDFDDMDFKYSKISHQAKINIDLGNLQRVLRRCNILNCRLQLEEIEIMAKAKKKEEWFELNKAHLMNMLMKYQNPRL